MAFLSSAAAGLAPPALANDAAMQAFAEHCFSPRMTDALADRLLATTGARVDFYDLNPGFAEAPSPAETAATPGTDRRCELAFDGARGAAAAEAAAAGLASEGIAAEAPLPLSPRPDETTTLRGARFLNPQRIAVVETGTRPGPNGPETFLRVERLTPEASREAAR